MFWWGKFRQTVETFILPLIVLPGERRNSRLYLHTKRTSMCLIYLEIILIFIFNPI